MSDPDARDEAPRPRVVMMEDGRATSAGPTRRHRR